MSNSRKVRSKWKADQLVDTNHVTFANPTVKRVQYTDTSDLRLARSTSVLGRLMTVPRTQGLSTSTIPELAIPPRTKEKTQIQNAQLLDDFVEHFEELGHLCLNMRQMKWWAAHAPVDEKTWLQARSAMIVQAINCHAKYALLKHTSKIRSIGLKSGTLCRDSSFDMIYQNLTMSYTSATMAIPALLLAGNTCSLIMSKKAAYDYLGAIRRLTDKSFTADVPNPYAAFLHLNQSQRTLDGNFQCNQFTKNTDPDDVSLCAGKGYFPLDSEYHEYLTQVPVSKEKSTCTYLKAVNKQDKKKFKNMAITGTVNCQCSHVFILSCVDLYHGERLFANSDMALAMDLKQHQPNESFQVKLQLEVDDIDEVSTYDIAYEYFIHLEERFQKNFSDLVHIIKQMRWGVPALHVQGHQNSCTYLFGTAYMECVGHFHSETAEQYWPEANYLGPHNTMNMAISLAEDIAEAKVKYVEKRNHFIGLSVSFHDWVKKWKEMPHTSTKKGKEAVSVYKHNSTKGMLLTFHRTTFRDLIGSYMTVPSQLAIYQKMLSDESAFASTKIPKSKVSQFLDEGFKIQDAQQKEIVKHTLKIQTELMPLVGDTVAAQTLNAPPVHYENLFLPSDFSLEKEQQILDLISLGVEEAKWREGEAFDHLCALQKIVKTITALRNRKGRDECKQKENTRASDNIREAITLRDAHMVSYEIARTALIAINVGSGFPPLTEPDLYMKSVQQKQPVVDSRHTDGALWQVFVPMPVEEDIDMEDAEGKDPKLPDLVPVMSSTQMDKRRSGPRNKPTKPVKLPVDERPAGWLWQLGKLTKMTDTEMEEWSSEGDRVQWFWAEAEMKRWQEQGEQKIAELLRSNQSFKRIEASWTALASKSSPWTPCICKAEGSNASKKS
ncbi:hypothetical protein C8J57DRAFT_1262468 [Mycena rebaudengoi]|nr:hypothetical protein C8J57DRAFT_1262468 [Mycena rebaudengoi]